MFSLCIKSAIVVFKMTKQLSEENGGGPLCQQEIIWGNISNVLNKHAAILKILQCAGCNIKNIAVCRLQLLKILQPILGNLIYKVHKN